MSASHADPELDPKDFVNRIRQLGEQRDQQDSERVRKLEEEVLQGRSERLARRAERQRSLSPDKPAAPAPASRSSVPDAASAPDMPASPHQAARDDSLQRLTGSPADVLDSDEPKKPAPSAAALARSGTLSWQQRRPQSGSLRRPLSTMSQAASDKASEPSSPADAAMSRDSIAQSLAAKDPSWFKQTPDRAIGSAALRRAPEDSPRDARPSSGASARRPLPGMAREPPAAPDTQPASPRPDSLRSTSPALSSARGSLALSNRFSANTSLSSGDPDPVPKARSPLPMLDSQKFAPPADHAAPLESPEGSPSLRGLAMSPTQGRISPERGDRPPSPTKGMGGFVQSAMMKRSDSVNKRWSTQTPPVLNRQSSTLSNRGSTTSSALGSLSRADSRPSTLSRDNSMEPASRPGSSSSNMTLTKDAAPKDEFVKPALPHHSRAKSVASTFSDKDDTSPPSPSKRWSRSRSPTKSSWLESALNKPDSPKPSQPPPQQPSWMSEINRRKEQRGSVDLSKASPSHSPIGDGTRSGRTSPIKEVRLRPISMRSPTKEEVKIVEQPAKDKAAPAPAEKPAPTPAPESSAPAAVETPSTAEDKPPTADPAPELSKETPKLADTPAPKPKPETPPKKDFRGSLRSRTGTFEQPKTGEANELQNVFGRLKKTETKNYVAPDTFKNNIVRGKSALNITGGPKPTVRRDEFRDSLVSQKAAMLAKAAETGSAAHKKSDSVSKPAPTPEALARRSMLGRSESISKPPPPKPTEAQPEALARIKSLRASKPVGKPALVELSGVPTKDANKDPVQAMEEEAASKSTKEQSKESVLPQQQAEPSRSVTQEPVKTSKLAERFNPALAGILARGPPGASKSPGPSPGSSAPASTTSVEQETGPGPELTHKTKGRARGPKRRAPAAKQTAPELHKSPSKVAPVAAVPLVKPEQVLSSNDGSKTDSVADKSVTTTPARESAREPSEARPAATLESPGLAGKAGPVQSPEPSKLIGRMPSPELPRKPPMLDMNRKPSADVKQSPISSPSQESLETSKPTAAPKPTMFGARPLPTPPVKQQEIRKQVVSPLKEIPTPNTESPPARSTPSPEKTTFSSVKNATALWGRQSQESSPVSSRTKSPIKLPTKADEQAAMEDAGLVRSREATPEIVEPKPPAPKSKPLGLGLGAFSGLSNFVSRSRESTPPAPQTNQNPISPPLHKDRPLSEPFTASQAPGKSDSLFGDYFDEPVVTGGELPEHIDPLDILKTTPIDLGPNGKIRTLRKQIQEITGDGKLISIPMQEEHVLFQDSMYLCTHIFGDSKGAKTTEVYLWCGNGVADATLEDAQLFARDIAKQSQGKLLILRQGKETPYFFEALGGIVVTRHGSHSATKEFMLCGRKHLGHIAFDEVDLSLNSLCSGFAFIISTKSGQIYLWKGRGCSAEELAAARLMGMDLNMDGNMLEMDEGSEPSVFFDAFPQADVPSDLKGKGPAIPRSADHWRYKATSEKYRARLFKLEQQPAATGWQNLQTPVTPKSPGGPASAVTKVVEIMPFCQQDLEPESVYVLDAFFDMYIIVGSLARSQAAAFSTALLFAQQYSILAVSEEDRPFMPVATVVLEGVPRDMKAVFRSWDDGRIPAAGLMSGKLGRGKSLRLVALDKALRETRG